MFRNSLHSKLTTCRSFCLHVCICAILQKQVGVLNSLVIILEFTNQVKFFSVTFCTTLSYPDRYAIVWHRLICSTSFGTIGNISAHLSCSTKVSLASTRDIVSTHLFTCFLCWEVGISYYWPDILSHKYVKVLMLKDSLEALAHEMSRTQVEGARALKTILFQNRVKEKARSLKEKLSYRNPVAFRWGNLMLRFLAVHGEARELID